MASVKNIENHNKLVQNISRLQIYPNTSLKSKSEFPRERSKRISRKVFNTVRDSNIPLGLKNCGGNVFSSTLSYRSCILYQYFEIILISISQMGSYENQKSFQGNRYFRCASKDVCYGRYLNLQYCKLGMEYDVHECLLQLLEKIYPILMMTVFLKLINLN